VPSNAGVDGWAALAQFRHRYPSKFPLRSCYTRAISGQNAFIHQWLVFWATRPATAASVAGLPAGWRVGDKSGSGERATNDVGVAWPPQSAPILIAVYLTGATANAEARNRTIAAVGSAIAAGLRG
jgi:beta-lactamase class A